MTLKGKFALPAALLAVALLSYLGVRLIQIRGLQNQLSSLAGKRQAGTLSPDDVGLLKRSFPVQAGVSSFVEQLYVLSREKSLENVEIVTVGDSPASSGKAAGRANAGATASHSIKISFSGTYRNTARFLEGLQHLERYTRVTSFDLRPDKASLRANVVVEIISLGGHDAA